MPESGGGQYLSRRGDFNAGSHINAFFRVHCKSAAPLGASADVKAMMAEKRQVTFFGKSVKSMYSQLVTLSTTLTWNIGAKEE